ncbi:MAG: Crp/Fnr family transcriptional regulator [Burkholderiaceae bacterium]|nr:MAG: Crp/Fnr family transcriptional regulator [Burkholderiaceae bacterium]TBR76266.1 MAG: Crp/Fnr family transcriptional regulator [Burkholderiaceae bacterium]
MDATRGDPTDAHLLTALSTGNRLLAQRGVLRRYPKNKVLIAEGSTGDTLFVLLAGSVKVYSMDQDGREITYGTIASGDYFGEMSLDGGVRSASVMTLEPCTCAVLGSAEVRACLAQHPDLAFDLLMQVIRRARTATDTARGMALLTVYGRVAALLQSLHGPAAEGASVTLRPITHQDIANRTGSSREMVSRLLKDLEKAGYIELGVKRITLLKALPARW